MSIFISYSRDDLPDLVAALREKLEHLGHDVWWDEASMSNRGRTFLHEIQSAIEHSDQLILVWGETAQHKAYVAFEWQHARDTGKVIVPLLIGMVPETLPEELRWCHAVIADTNAPTACFVELGRVLAEEPIKLAPLVDVPGLPPHFYPRRQDVDRIRRLALADKIAPEPMDGPARATVLHGMGGVGKSVLAAAFARSPFTRRCLEHGIYWLDGGDASPREILERLAQLIGAPGATADELRKILEARHVGVILDDATRGHVDAVLGVLGRPGRILATSRDASQVAHSGMNLHGVGLLTEAESLDLLAGWLGESIKDEPFVSELVELCGGIPLAITLNAGMLLSGWSGSRVVKELRVGNLQFAAGTIGGYGHESVARSLAVSYLAVADLGADAQQRLTELTAFMPQELIPLVAVARLWRASGGLDADASEDLAVRLSLRSLIRLQGTGKERTVDLHDLVRAFLQSKVPDPAHLNRTLLQAYGPVLNLSPDESDGYILRTIVRHMLQDGAIAAAHNLLTTTSADGRNAWFSRMDEAGLTDAFVADIRRLHRQAVTARSGCEDSAQHCELLAREHLYTLMSASIAAMAERLGPELLAAVANARLPEWPVARVLAYALTLPREGDRGVVLAEIWNLLPDRDRDRLFRPAVEWIAAMPFPHPRAKAYASLARRLDASRARFIVREVFAQNERYWSDIDSHLDPRWRIQVAGAVRLAEVGEVDEAIDMMMALPEQLMSDCPRREGLEAIVGLLPADGCRRVLEIEGQEPAEFYAWSAAIIAGRLAALGHINEALELARTVEPIRPEFPYFIGPDARILAYRNMLAPERTWPPSLRIEAEHEALCLADNESDAEWGMSAACIAGVLRTQDPAPLLRRILDLEPQRTSLALYAKEIAPFLPERARQESLTTWVQEMETQRKVLRNGMRVSYISWLIPLWSLDHLDELTALIGDDVSLDDRWEFDLAVAARQEGAGTARILRRVIRGRMMIGDEEQRRRAAEACRGLQAGHPSEQPAITSSECRSQIHEIAQLERPYERVEKLKQLLPSLTAHWDAVSDDVLDVLTELTPPTLAAATALVVATALKAGLRDSLVALAASRLRAETRPAEEQTSPFRALHDWKPMTRAEIEALERIPQFRIRISDGEDARTNAIRIARLANALDAPERELVATELLHFANSLPGPHRADVAAPAIRGLPPHARSAAADELREWANTIDDDPYARAVALAAAAVADPPAPRWEDVRAAIALQDELAPRERQRVFEWLTAHRSSAVFEEVLDAIEELPRGQAQAQAVEAAILNGPPGGWDRVLKLIEDIGNSQIELILLHEAITIAPEPVRAQCRSRVPEVLGAIDPATVESAVREHIIELLPALEPLGAEAALAFLWQTLAGRPRSELLEVFLRTAPLVRQMNEQLSGRLAENIQQAGRWWP